MRKFHRELNKGLNAIMAELEESEGNWLEAARQYDQALLYASDKESQDYYRQKRQDAWNMIRATKQIT